MNSVDHYVRSRQIELAHIIKPRKKVYLDLRFWIFARDAHAGQNIGVAERKLLHFLRRGVAQGTLVCPISESTFIEMMKQANTPTRRMATAALIDELSLGVSFTTGTTRISTEIGHFFYRQSGDQELYDMQELIWTKLSYTMGYLHPSYPRLDKAAELEIQKAFFDLMWTKSLSEMVATIGDNWVSDAKELERSAAAIDKGMKAPEHRVVSFEQAYRDEIVGVVDVCGDLAAEAMAGMAERAGMKAPQRGSNSWNACANMCRNLLVAAFAKPDAKLALRTMHIHATLHAGMRWEKSAKFTANHYWDFEHSACALAYCDAFLTEAFLSNLINAGHIRLGELNNCVVTNEVSQAVEILKALQPAS